VQHRRPQNARKRASAFCTDILVSIIRQTRIGDWSQPRFSFRVARERR